MIKKYNQFLNESILDELKGPSEEEIWKNLKDLQPNRLLFKSVNIGLLKGVKLALEKGADINYDKGGPLRIAVKNENIELVKLLLKNGADVNGERVLNYAILTKDDTILKLLLKHNPKIKKHHLKTAIESNKYHNLSLLIKCLGDTNESINIINESLLDELKGPSKEEVWTNLGLGSSEKEVWKKFNFDETFETAEEFFLFLIKDLTPIKDKKNDIKWVKNNDIFFIQQKMGGKLLIMNYAFWVIFINIFAMMNNSNVATFIREMIIKHNVNNWKSYWVTYGNMD